MSLAPATRDRRRAGTALLAYGLVGLVILALVAVGVLAAVVRARSALDTVASERNRLVTLVDSTTAALDASGRAITGVGRSLDTAGTAIGDAANLARTVSTGARNLTGVANLSILGQQPLAGFTGDLNAVADGTDKLASTLDQAAAALSTNSTDAAAVQAQLGVIRTTMLNLRADLVGFDLGVVDLLVGVAVVLLALVAWLAVGAAGVAWIGVRWMRSLPPSP